MSGPEFVLNINGTRWDKWEAINLKRSIERMAGEFSVNLTRNSEDGDATVNDAFTPLANVTVEIDGTPVLVGYVDQTKYDYSSNSSTISISGRDKTGDLVDCAARLDDMFEFRKQKLDAMVKAICKPYGINVSVMGDVGKAFDVLAVEPTESAFDFIERACRYRQKLPVSDGIGGIVLAAPHGAKSPGKLVYGQNILQGSLTLDYKDRFSIYVMKGQATGWADDSDAATSSHDLATQEARVKDAEINRYRPKLLTGETQSFEQTLQQRVEWEKKMAIARSKVGTYTVQGWYADAESKELWKPNTVVSLNDPRAGINRDMLITGVTFNRANQSGTTTQLDLALPEAFDLTAYKAPANNSTWAADND